MEKTKSYINIFRNDGMLQTGLGLYADKKTAEETGKMIKGYLLTIQVSFPIIKEEKSND